jgi:hypothetical protein
VTTTIEPRRHVRLRDGQVRELLAGEIIPDGATVFVPLLLRDAERRSLRDAAEKAYTDYVARLSDAWRPEPVKVAATPEAAYEDMCAYYQNAWMQRR